MNIVKLEIFEIANGSKVMYFESPTSLSGDVVAKMIRPFVNDEKYRVCITTKG